MHIKNTDWKELYDLLNDLIITKNSESLVTELESNINRVVPADRGVPIFEIIHNRPICIRWPEYSSKLIPRFNNHFNEICPVKYDSYLDGLSPVSWRSFKNSEYDSDFNTPLDIGFSMGSGFYNQSDGKFKIVVVNRGRKTRPFTSTDMQIFTSLIKSFSVLYNQRESIIDELESRIYKLEQHQGGSLLSEREIQICRLLCTGIKAADIAETLGISRRTVERHKEHIYFKLGVKNRKELFRQLKV